MSVPNGAGELRERVLLQRRGTIDDGFGNMVPGGDFETVATVWGRLMPLRGSESVMQARLSGRQPYVLTVRQSTTTRQVTEAWRVVDARNIGRVFAITAPPADPNGRRAWLDILIVEGEGS